MLPHLNFITAPPPPRKIVALGPKEEAGSISENEMSPDRVMMVAFYVSFSILLTFRKKVGFGFDRGSTVGVGSKFFGRFDVKG